MTETEPTRFQRAVTRVVAGLEPGDVITYGEVAAEAGFHGAARAVGTLLRDSGADLPWWRVVGAGGHLRAPDAVRQARLLADEGVLVVDGRVASQRQT